MTIIIKMDRVWAMPSTRQFSIPAIARLIREECDGCDQKSVIEPFPYQAKRDAFEYLKSLPTASVSVCLLDPPYSSKQAVDNYNVDNNNGSSSSVFRTITWQSPKAFWSQMRDEITRVIRPGGKCITLAWNSQGIGKGRGFEITRILLVAHGGGRNDTILTVEKKINGRLDKYIENERLLLF